MVLNRKTLTSITPYKSDLDAPYRELEPNWKDTFIPTYTRITVPLRLNRAKQKIWAEVAEELRVAADRIEEASRDHETKSEFLNSRIMGICMDANRRVKLLTRLSGD